MPKKQPENVATARDNNPIKRDPLTFSPAMRVAAERAAAAQPPIMTASSMVNDWRSAVGYRDE